MTALRLIPLPIHTALEMAAGLLLMAAPFALGLSLPAVVVGVAIGALLVGLALHAVEISGSRTIAIGAHHAYDFGFALGLVGAAIALAAAGDTRATVLFAGFALAQLALTLTTRYSAR